MSARTVLQEEVPFLFSELFVSMTDPRGIILSGNDVFVRISGYTREQLIGSPHNVIRHPDMPKAIFKLLWSTIQSGKPIAAYVKNRSIDGRYYWVLAVVVPVPEGYLSIRIKPSSEVFKKVVGLYDVLLKEEARTSPDRALEKLGETLRELGFADYPTFMAHALSVELKARDQEVRKGAEGSRQESARHLSNPTRFEGAVESIVQVAGYGSADFKGAYDQYQEVKDLQKVLETHTDRIFKACQRLENLSMNMNVSANKLGKDGVSLSVVAGAFQRTAGEILSKFGRFTELVKESSSRMTNSRFALATARLQSEMLWFCAKEAHDRNLSSQAMPEAERRRRFVEEFQMVSQAVRSSFAQVKTEQELVLDNLKQFHKICQALRSVILGLDLIRLGGKLEGSRTSLTQSTFTPYTLEMNRFIEDVQGPIEEIGAAIADVIRAFELLQAQLSAISLRLIELDMLGTRIPQTLTEEVAA